MDYKELLRKYMRHVYNEEGTHFGAFYEDLELGITVEEARELQLMADTIDAEEEGK